MTDALNSALCDWLLAQADDQVIMAHRASEWTGHAPILEEDIALANIAQDELGHATLWYGLLASVASEAEDYPDRLVYERAVAAWRNLQLVELPNGDWAFTMLRQFFMDVYEQVQLAHLERSQHTGIAEIAAKVRREELYHLKHTSAWVRRLALGTEESHGRMQAALDAQWPYIAQLFAPLPGEEQLVAAGYVPGAVALRAEWEGVVLPLLAEGELRIPDAAAPVSDRAEHTPHLRALLDDLQQVARLDREADW